MTHSHQCLADGPCCPKKVEQLAGQDQRVSVFAPDAGFYYVLSSSLPHVSWPLLVDCRLDRAGDCPSN